MTAPSPAAGAVTAPARPAVLTIEGLEKRRERGGVTFVLHVPHLQLLRGSFVAIVGASGCGKSTLLDLIALVLEPDQVGRFEFARENEALTDVARLWTARDERALAAIRATDLGYVLQTGGLLPFLNVRDNILLPARINGARGSFGEVERLADQLGIADTLSAKPQFLSGGQRQRVAIARALVHQPSVILADEPTAAVDETRAEDIVRDFHRLARYRQTTVAMVTHHLDLVLPFADAVYTFKVRKISAQVTLSVFVPWQANKETLRGR